MGAPIALATNGDGAARPGIDLDEVDEPPLYRELDVHQPRTPSASASATVCRSISRMMSGSKL
jgi:hypothetical protein